MDEGKFDDKIREKLGEYSAPGFDPNALAALHQKMAGKNPLSWYQKYKLQTVASLLTMIISLVIIGSQWYLNTKSTTLLEKENAALRDQVSTLNQVKDELERLKSEKPDTTRIVQIDRSRNFLKPDFNAVAGKFRSFRGREITLSANGFLNLGRLQELPVEILEILIQEGYSLKEENGKVFIKLTNSNRTALPQVTSINPDYELFRYNFNVAFSNDENETNPVEEKNVTIQGKLLRELESHYQRGVGIKVGPTGEVVRLNNLVGEDAGFVSVGLLADFFLSPQWSMETGVKYSERSATVEGTQELKRVVLPHLDEETGSLHKLEVDSKTIEIPFYLKYHYQISPGFNLIGGAGASGLLFIHQDFEYSYHIPESNGNKDFSVIADHELKKWTFYPATVNLLAGINKQFDNNKTLEVSLFYQKGIRNTGKERMKADLFGVRAAYWFKVR